ncbi:LysR family transcriptional regulator ArgP [Jeongeupia sp. USM3]|uniref:LysR family transcriptional regulator ArgP n=1 Tax=Jeongeupia sp. USM3 TaxID=1906741 RepID=UPI00089DEAF6|nr:LysR family transcriptional regulator ArgP [Jeongeupia sp. USM3]AOY01973.1 transcriptional regulator ArgP [Jeongeupia sp. USM3]
MFDGKLTEAFLAVVREGSFDRAAAALHLTQSAVSQRVRALESRFGQTLLTRGRPCVPTGAGQTLLRYLDRIRLLEEEALRTLAGPGEGPSRLALAVNADSLHAWLPKVLAETLAGSPFTVELQVDNEDYTHQLLARGEVLACVSARFEPMRGCVAEPLGALRYICAATPRFAARHFAGGVSRTALLRAPGLLYNRKDAMLGAYLSRHFGISEGHYPAHLMPSSQAFVDFALLDVGYVLVPELAVAPQLASGALIDLLPAKPHDVPLFWHAWQIQAPMVDVLFRRIVTAATAVLRQPD